MDGLGSAWIGRVAAVLLVAACNGDDTTASGDDSSSSGSPEPTTEGESDTGDDPDTSSGTLDDGSSSDESTTGLPDVDPIAAGEGVVAGNVRTCNLDDGTLTCWGANNCGLLGDGTELSRTPVVIAPEHTWASVSLGTSHSCAIDDEGALWCWGSGLQGQLGTGDIYDGPPFDGDECKLEPLPIAEGTTWARVSLGRRHTCGVSTDGSLWCWGANDSGQIGDGSVGPLYTRVVPTEVGGDAWLDVYAGMEHSCALRSDATVWCWGAGNALGDTDLLFSSTPVEVVLPSPIRALARGGATEHTCAITEDDTVWCWGVNQGEAFGPGDPMDVPVELETGGAVDEVVVQSGNTCVLRSDGTMLCLGFGGYGQLGDGIAELGHNSSVALPIPIDAPVESIALGQGQACARTEDGVVYCWGHNQYGEIGDGTSGSDNSRLVPTPAVPWGGGPIATGWTGVALGRSSACGLRDGAPWCWGGRAYGALGNDDPVECGISNLDDCVFTTPVEVSTTGEFTALSVGDGFACGLRDDGTLWCWGNDDAGQLGSEGELALVPAQVGTENDWTKVEVGRAASCGVRSPGTLWCWGDDESGQLGDGTVGGFSTTPTQVGADADWIDVVVGDTHACGLRTGGALACWGRNSLGQLGSGAETDDPVPTPSVVPGTWSSVATGRSHTCGVAEDGAAWCWGFNNDGAVDPDEPAIVPAPVQIGADSDWQAFALGESFSCGLRVDGSAWCWGSNYAGQIGTGEVGSIASEPTMVADIDDFLAITGDGSTVCGVRSDTTVMCWGANGWGQQGNDTTFTSGVPREVRDDG